MIESEYPLDQIIALLSDAQAMAEAAGHEEITAKIALALGKAMLAAFNPPQVRSPRHPYQYPDREIDCQKSADKEFRELWGYMSAAGWGDEEIAAAFYELTDNQLTALRMNEKTEAEIRRARKMRGLD